MLECPAGLCGCQNSTAQQKLNLLEVQVSKSLVPSQQFLFSITEIEVAGVDLVGYCVERQRSLFKALDAVCGAFGDAVDWVDPCLDWGSGGVSLDSSEGGSLFIKVDLLFGVIAKQDGGGQQLDWAVGTTETR